MLPRVVLVLVISALTACGPKGQQAGQGTADSTASGSVFTDSAKAQDSIGPAQSADSTASSTSASGAMRPVGTAATQPVGTAATQPVGTAATQLRDSATSKAMSKSPATGAYIGRDSAFGPTYTVDSTGKVTPIIPAKKKP